MRLNYQCIPNILKFRRWPDKISIVLNGMESAAEPSVHIFFHAVRTGNTSPVNQALYINDDMESRNKVPLLSSTPTTELKRKRYKDPKGTIFNAN